jgi:ribose transport system permease protein
MTDQPANPAATQDDRQLGSLPQTFSHLQRRYLLLQFVALIGLFIYGSATISGFSSELSVRSMLVLAALLGLAALGQTLVMILGGLDLSVPGFIALGAIMVSVLTGTKGWPLLPSLIAIVLVAAAGGYVSGWISHRAKINPLIVTLGVGSLALGLPVVWANGNIPGVPTAVSDITAINGTTFGMSVSPIVVIWVVIAICVGVILHLTPAGRRLFATGANQRAAELALINTQRVWTSVFAISAVGSALVGVMLAGYSGADPAIGGPYLFEGLAAVIVGGTVFGGTRGDYTHTLIGALILTELTSILIGRGVDDSKQQIIFGVLILLVVAGYGREKRLRDFV